MSTGTQIAFGVAIAVVVFGGWLATRRRKPVERRPVTPDLDARLRELVVAGKPIVAVKELRHATGMGLREAKEHVDALAATGEPPPPPRDDVSAETTARVRELLAAGKVVHAVKAVREETGWGLRQAKEFVDGLR